MVAAAVAAVVPAGAGVTYALVGTGDDGTRQQAVGSASGASPSASGAQDGTGGGATAASPGPTGKDGRTSASPGATRPAKDGKGGKGSGEKGGAAPGRAPTGGHATATPGGAGGTAGGGTGSAPVPSRHSIGAGRFGCQVWRTAKSYRHDGGGMGVLNAGTDYFYGPGRPGPPRDVREVDQHVLGAHRRRQRQHQRPRERGPPQGGANNAPVPGLRSADRRLVSCAGSF
ncbi:hypothetical protein [Streptomyces sp. NPDC059994]|uniref:hypothetical protein n=1 Tax=Streptomyces sp. NPDC059994 TaxID=3347029 RepID=UPI00369F8BCA